MSETSRSATSHIDHDHMILYPVGLRDPPAARHHGYVRRAVCAPGCHAPGRTCAGPHVRRVKAVL